MHGALINLTADATGISFPVIPIPYDNAVYDTDGIFNPLVPGTLTIPPGFSWAKLSVGLSLPSVLSAGGAALAIYANGSPTLCACAWPRNSGTGFSDNRFMSFTPWIPVVGGEYFECRVNVHGLGSPNRIVADAGSFFHIELLP